MDMMNLFNGNNNNNNNSNSNSLNNPSNPNNSTGNGTQTKSRFQVTPRIDIESQFVEVVTPSTPQSTSGDGSPDFGPYNTLNGYFTTSELDETVSAGKVHLHNNNNTTTSTSSTSSFYNTIYKYNKLKQNGESLDQVYFPLPIRRPSSAPHSVVGISFYNERVLVYNFLQRPTGLLAISYHIFVSVAVVYCLVLTILASSSDFSSSVNTWLNTIDYMIIIFFVVEFLARLWASECVSYYRGWKGKVRFFKNPIRIIDLFVIVVSLAVLVCNAKGELLVTSLRGVRFIQIFQMVRLDFKFRPWRMMASVVYSQRIHLAIVFYMGFLALLLVSFVIYFVEKDHNQGFNSLASSMWWAVITLCTIGYGDTIPVTSTGKFLACICSLIGVSIFALPAGILGTGLALKVQEQQRQLKMSKRKQPAARLIQSAWKFYKSEQEQKRSSATFYTGSKNSVVFPGRSILYKRFESHKNKTKILNTKEVHAIHFYFSVKLSIAKRDFVKAFKPYDIKDVLELYAANHADMLAKVRTMDHRLEKIQSNTLSSKAQNESRLLFATHLTKLDYEIQKLQMNFNEMLRYQIDSRLVLENLLKFMIDQQIRLNSNMPANRCQFCPQNGNCQLCSTANEQLTKLVSSMQHFDLPAKINQTVASFNTNLMQHLQMQSDALAPPTSDSVLLPKRKRRKSF